ncbi:Inositol-tetrakisphosphate 1-kinase 1 [Striga hermonthica]|uniref:Inositol-tetrakisphosphate 1-kinase n=1 Tax=Striga hermonthica TaxID=68872 RepID=A0A9N7MPW9_STRHE|nr:Inositol-tetrakisphosphate 1-kinase 1 [Striga hermonthica]
MADNTTRYRIGYALASKKIQSFIQPSLLNTASERGIDLVSIQLTKPLLDQPPFDCIIHKLSDPDWIHQLQQYLSENPNAVVIDKPAAIDRLHSRVTMLQAVGQLDLPPQFSLEIPRQVLVGTPDSSPAAVATFDFPAIAKPVVADGSAVSHRMFLVLDEDGLDGLRSKLEAPFVLQEFVNHGGVIFKVYVAGKHVQCVKRPSLPDISEEKLGSSEKLIPFSQISNATYQDQSNESVARAIEAAELPPLGFVNEVASQLREALELNLFNFDMIRDSRIEGRYLVIDINYFPGYAKMPSYEKILTDFFLDILENKESVASEDRGPA